ncbi:MAG: hypothetical protein L6367_10910, partial [Cellulomonas sp.]|nr:hypothetical protein [Cellulomonas sp.]
MRWCPLAVVALALPLLLTGGASAGQVASLPADETSAGSAKAKARASGNAVDVEITDRRDGQPDSFDPTGAVTRRVAPALVRHLRAEICGVFSAGHDQVWPCPGNPTFDHSDVCGDAPALRPWWASTRAGVDADWSPWELVEGVTCAGGPDPTAEQVLSEFRRLPIAPSVLTVQPDRGWVLVNVETIAYTDPVPQTLTATV